MVYNANSVGCVNINCVNNLANAAKRVCFLQIILAAKLAAQA